MVSSKEESYSEDLKSANSEYGASWQQDSDEEDLMSSEGSSRSTYKRKRTSSLPAVYKKNILAPTYPDVPVVNSSLFQNPWPWMCPPWMQNPWVYSQPMPMSPPWTTMGAQPAVMSYNPPWVQVPPPQWDHLKDYGGNGSQMKKAEKRVKARKHVKNVSDVGRKAKVRKVVKLQKKKRGDHLSLTEKLRDSKHHSKHPKAMGKRSRRSVGSFAARMSVLENWQKEMEGKLSKLQTLQLALTEALHEFGSKLVEFVNYIDNENGNPMQKRRN